MQPLSCGDCGYLTLSSAKLELHKTGIHPPLSPTLKCPGCPNQFRSPTSLKEHLHHDHSVDPVEIQAMLVLAATQPSRIFIKSVDVLRNPEKPANEPGDLSPGRDVVEDILTSPGPRQKIYLKNVNELVDQFPVPALTLPPQPSYPIPTPPLPSTPVPVDVTTPPIAEPPALVFAAAEAPKNKIYIRNVQTLIQEPERPVAPTFVQLPPVELMDIDLEEVQSLPPQRNDIVVLDEMPSLDDAIFTVSGADVLELAASEEFAANEPLKGFEGAGQASAFMANTFRGAEEDEEDALPKEFFYFNGGADFELCSAPPKNDEEDRIALPENYVCLPEESPEPLTAEVPMLPRMPLIYVSNTLADPVAPAPPSFKEPPAPTLAMEAAKTRGRPRGGKNHAKDAFPFQCLQRNCPRKFRAESTLAYHQRCHDGGDRTDGAVAIVCPECGTREFAKWDQLHSHLWRLHSIDMELYSCELCSYKTPNLSSLKNTHLRTHSEEKSFRCSQCPKAFKNCKQLKNHRRHHRLCELKRTAEVSLPDTTTPTGDAQSTEAKSPRPQTVEEAEDGKRDFKCEECGHQTSHRNSARRHRLIHSGERPYKCPECSYSCIQSNSFRAHLEKLHPDLAKELISRCALCPFSTINSSKLEVHMRRRHEAGEVASGPCP